MEATRFTCPHCLYEAELHMFENMANGKLKCRRCRSEVQDPNAFSAQRTYADCDSHRAVTRFPFHLNGKDAMIRVRHAEPQKNVSQSVCKKNVSQLRLVKVMLLSQLSH